MNALALAAILMMAPEKPAEQWRPVPAGRCAAEIQIAMWQKYPEHSMFHAPPHPRKRAEWEAKVNERTDKLVEELFGEGN